MMRHFHTETFDSHSLSSPIAACAAGRILDVFLKKYQKVSTDLESRKSRAVSRESENEKSPVRGFRGYRKTTKDNNYLPKSLIINNCKKRLFSC